MSLRSKTLTVTRKAAGSFVKGVWTPSLVAATTFTILASVQPATPRDLQSLPEERRNRQSYLIFTSTQLLTVDVPGVTNPDIVSIYGEDYEVSGPSAWQNGILDHYEIIVQKIDD